MQGNYIGTDVSGTADLGNSLDGVVIFAAPNNTIGGTTAGAGNIISGNRFRGVQIFSLGARGTQVQGNFIGTDVNGTADLGNAGSGVVIAGPPNNTVGGASPSARNIISGNDGGGVVIEGNRARGNQVLGNFIGTDVNGTADLGNSLDGVQIFDAPNNAIGGTTPGARNVISGNNGNGVAINGSLATESQVQGNYIGTDVSGTRDLGNSHDGVLISSAPSNTIGGAAAGAGNIISGNGFIGVRILSPGASGTQVQGNYIGTDVNGTADLGNSLGGVQIFDAPNNTIGGTTPGARNVISGNKHHGVQIIGSGATETQVQGNYIGTDLTGMVALATPATAF
ncbi:MAG: hypothetical protein NZ823_00775 [Blastocatellia bacterium]|nr:hypothetical protein [Blastocatellia bacterium]